MIYSWRSDPFLAGPPGYCDTEYVMGPYFPTEELADLHAKANVLRVSSNVRDVRTPTSSYTIVKLDRDDLPMFKRIYVQTILPVSGSVSINDYANVYENSIKTTTLTSLDTDFYMKLKEYPIKGYYIYDHDYIGIEF
jgi:hypothetical protein